MLRLFVGLRFEMESLTVLVREWSAENVRVALEMLPVIKDLVRSFDGERVGERESVMLRVRVARVGSAEGE